VWQSSLTDYLGRLNQPEFPSDLERLRRLLVHLRSTDPDRFLVATRPVTRADAGLPTTVGRERVVGFGSANVRGRAWFLAMLFVEPSEQSAGLGRRLLDATLAGLPSPTASQPVDGGQPWAFGTATDSAQPISNALYASYGVVPRVPVLHLVGRLDRTDALPSLPVGITGVPIEGSTPDDRFDDDIAGIDREVLGYEHPEDHAWIAEDRRPGYIFRRANGTAVGYGYASRVGRVGPIAALDAALLAPITAHLLSAIEPNGAFSVWVPGSAGETVAMLLGAGFRLESFPALLCWSRPYVDVSRYIPNTLALL
jgi:GNAT superfamily N-acetyltransferase